MSVGCWLCKKIIVVFFSTGAKNYIRQSQIFVGQGHTKQQIGGTLLRLGLLTHDWKDQLRASKHVAWIGRETRPSLEIANFGDRKRIGNSSPRIVKWWQRSGFIGTKAYGGGMAIENG